MPVRIAPVKSALVKFAPPRSVLVRLAPPTWAPLKVISCALACARSALERMAPVKSAAPHAEWPNWKIAHSDREAPDRFAWVRLAWTKLALVQLACGKPCMQLMNCAPAKSANERSIPERLTPLDRLAFGQLVKWVGVGFETMVQPSMTMSAAAGVAVAVANTGVASAVAIAKATPVTRRICPTMVASPDRRYAQCYGRPVRDASGSHATR